MKFLEAYEQMKKGKTVKRPYLFSTNYGMANSFMYYRYTGQTFYHWGTLPGWKSHDPISISEEELDATDWEVVE
jgi:hypothetical protein